MKRMVKKPSSFDMIDAFNERIEELEGCDKIASATYTDAQGMMGEPGATYTDFDLKNIWDNEHEDDPSMKEYPNYQAWRKSLREWLTPVEGATLRKNFSKGSVSHMKDAFERKIEQLEGIDSCDIVQASAYDDLFSFGVSEANQFGDMICEQLAGQTISKRKDLAHQPGGLVYEAEQLGIDTYELLRALEGMCKQGRASEIDDSTYKVLGQCQASIEGADYSDIDGDAQNYADWGVTFIRDIDNFSALVKDDYTGQYTRWSKMANRPLSKINRNNEYIPLWFNSEEEAINASEDIEEDKPYWLSHTDEWVAEADRTAEEMEENGEFYAWEELASKQVPDSDGFLTDYTLYRCTYDDTYVCVFGDKDFYRPEQGEFDWEGESEEEAWEWFNDYEPLWEDENVYDEPTWGSSQINAAWNYGPELAEWLEEHDEAYTDACNYFDTTDLSTVPQEQLIAWISDHEWLKEDCEARFGEAIFSACAVEGGVYENAPMLDTIANELKTNGFHVLDVKSKSNMILVPKSEMEAASEFYRNNLVKKYNLTEDVYDSDYITIANRA